MQHPVRSTSSARPPSSPTQELRATSPVWSHLEPVCESVTRTGGTGHRCRALLAYTSSAGNQGIEVAFTGAHLGSCQPGNDAGALRRTTRDYKSTRCRTSPDPRQRVRTSWSKQPLLCHTPDITAVTVERAVGAERCCGLAAPSQQLQILLPAADSNKRPSPLHTRSLALCAVSCMHCLSGGHSFKYVGTGRVSGTG